MVASRRPRAADASTERTARVGRSCLTRPVGRIPDHADRQARRSAATVRTTPSPPLTTRGCRRRRGPYTSPGRAVRAAGRECPRLGGLFRPTARACPRLGGCPPPGRRRLVLDSAGGSARRVPASPRAAGGPFARAGLDPSQSPSTPIARTPADPTIRRSADAPMRRCADPPIRRSGDPPTESGQHERRSLARQASAATRRPTERRRSPDTVRARHRRARRHPRPAGPPLGEPGPSGRQPEPSGALRGLDAAGAKSRLGVQISPGSGLCDPRNTIHRHRPRDVGIRQYSCNQAYQRIIIPQSSWRERVGGHEKCRSGWSAARWKIDLLLTLGG